MIYLKIRFPSGKVEERALIERSFVIGRSLKSNVVVDSESISRQHCLIEFKNDCFFITDLQSVNGVFIGGERIAPSLKTPFQTYMELTLGEIEIRLEWKESANSSDFKTTKTKYPEQKKENLPVNEAQIERKPDKSDQKKSFPSQNLKMIVGFLVILSIIFYLFQQEQSPIPSPTTEQSVPERKKAKINSELIAEAFFTDSEYLEYFKSKGCGLKDICQEFELDPAAREGTTILKQESIIYFDPSDHFQKNIFENFRSLPNGRFLVPIYYLVKSEFFVDFLNKEIAQIHIVIVKEDGSFDEILRLHSKDFDGTATRKSLIKDLMSIKDDVSADLFLTNYKIRKKSDA